MKKVRISLGCTVMIKPSGDLGREVGWPGEDKEAVCVALPPGLTPQHSNSTVCYGSDVLMALGCPLLLGLLPKWVLPFRFPRGYPEGWCTAHSLISLWGCTEHLRSEWDPLKNLSLPH